MRVLGSLCAQKGQRTVHKDNVAVRAIVHGGRLRRVVKVIPVHLVEVVRKVVFFAVEVSDRCIKAPSCWRLSGRVCAGVPLASLVRGVPSSFEQLAYGRHAEINATWLLAGVVIHVHVHWQPTGNEARAVRIAGARGGRMEWSELVLETSSKATGLVRWQNEACDSTTCILY